MSGTEDDDYSSELFDQIVRWQFPVFAVSDENEQREKLRATLRTETDSSLPRRNFVPRAKAVEMKDIFPPKEEVVRKMRDLLYDLLRPKCLDGTRFEVGHFVLTLKAMRVWKVMEMCYQILWQNLAYFEWQLCNILCRGFSCYFPKESHVRKAISDLEKLMQCSRYSFGIRGTKRIMVPGYPTVECYSGIPLASKIQVLQNMTMTLIIEDIHCIIVVQETDTLKDLVECPLFNNFPIILITTEGIPEFTTRFFLHRLSTEHPDIPIYGLVDWSPAGLEVLCSYKYGNTGSRFERNKLACDKIEWLGVANKDIVELEEQSERSRKSVRSYVLTFLLEGLTLEDEEIVRRLKSFFGVLPDGQVPLNLKDQDYMKELDMMAMRKHKASTRAVTACFNALETDLSACVLSKVYTLSRNIRWLNKKEGHQSMEMEVEVEVEVEEA